MCVVSGLTVRGDGILRFMSVGGTIMEEYGRTIRDMPARQRGSVHLLYTCMNDLSERYWAARWINGLEYTLWTMANGLGKRRRRISRCEAERLLKLSNRVGGWIVWDDLSYEDIQKLKTDTTTIPHGPRFVPMSQWLEMYSRRAMASPEQSQQLSPN